MNNINAVNTIGNIGVLSHAFVRNRSLDDQQNQLQSMKPSQALFSYVTLSKTIRLREALDALKFSSMRPSSKNIGIEAIHANAISNTGIDFSTVLATDLRSTEEVNTAPTSFTAFGPNIIGSTLTAPWSGPGSTAEATVGGAYDGSNGNGTLTFRVNPYFLNGVEGKSCLDAGKIGFFAMRKSRVLSTLLLDGNPQELKHMTL